MNFSFEWKEPYKNGAKFSTNHWLALEMSICVDILTSQKQSKETENRDTLLEWLILFTTGTSVSELIIRISFSMFTKWSYNISSRGPDCDFTNLGIP